MRRLMIVVLLAAALAFGANEAAKRFLKPTGAGKPTITDTETPKRAAPGKRSSSKRSTSKGKGAQAKSSAGRPAKANAAVAKADSNAAKADAAIAKPVGSAAKVDVPVAKVVGDAAKVDVPVAKADGNAAKVDVAKPDGNAAKAEAEGEPKSEKKTSEVASSVTSSGTTSTYVPASDTSSKTTSPDRIDFSATAIGLKLQKDNKLRAKIETKLQAAGYSGTVYEAAYGFENVGQLNAATDMVQNHGHSFELLKVLMTGKYVDPKTHLVYRAHQGADGTVKLLSPELATNPVLR
jgi:putative transposon-encoded protein